MQTCNPPKLSVIVPVYGTEQYLPACLDSILAQSWEAIEILIVDDKSPDRAPEIAERYAARHENIRVIHHPENRGLFRTRVTGLAEMTGDFFAFVDSDDTVTSDYYRLMLEEAQRCGADLVAGDFLEVRGGQTYYPNRMLQQRDYDLEGAAVLDTLMAQEGADYGWHITWNKVYSRRLRDRLLPFLQTVDANLTMCEDVAFSSLFFAAAQHFVNVHGEYYLYLRHSGASTALEGLTLEKCQKAVDDIAQAFRIVREGLAVLGAAGRCEPHLQAWSARLALGWQDLAKGCKGSPAGKQAFEESVRRLCANVREPDRLKQDFYGSRQILMPALPQQELKQAIASATCRIVSFDVFDTLLLRPFLYPTDLFEWMEPGVTKIVGTADNVEFRILRTNAERCARKAKEDACGTPEVTLAEIYAQLQRMCPRLSPYLDAIRQYELDSELRFCMPRKKGLELVRYARALGKTVVFTSDMYLPRDFIGRMLAKCGVPLPDRLFVSCETGCSKAEGALYDQVARRLNAAPRQCVHVGDSMESDVKQARKKGWNAFYLPKTADCLMNRVPGRYYGDLYERLYRQNQGMRLTSGAANFFYGSRCLLAVAANKIFDDPFLPVAPDSDFNADPCRIGYLAMGPYLVAICRWLAQLCQKEKFERLNFVARDGWVPLQAFEILQSALGLHIPTGYVYASRKVLATLLVKNPAGIYSMPENYNIAVLTPQKVLDIFRAMIRQDRYESAPDYLRAQGFACDVPFGTIQRFEAFAELLVEHFLDEPKRRDYFQKVERYYAPFFSGHCATFDVGYSCRFESLLKQNFGFDVTACYLHINGSRALVRKAESGIGLFTFYDFIPTVTGTIREHSISKLGPSCVGFDCSGETAVPLFEEYESCPETVYLTQSLQNSALDYVRDLCAIFGGDLRTLAFRQQDAALPMEYFFHFAKPYDAEPFAAIPFEDDMGSDAKTLRDLWAEAMDNARSGMPGGPADERLNYYRMSKPKKWLVWLLVDRKTLKDTAERKLQGHAAVRKLFFGVYNGCRSLYHRLSKT
ncbi:MAG: glycosyltransferase [Gemmiger sp.]